MQTDIGVTDTTTSTHCGYNIRMETQAQYRHTATSITMNKDFTQVSLNDAGMYCKKRGREKDHNIHIHIHINIQT